MIKGDSYSTNQDFYDLQWKTFFLHEMKSFDTQMLKLPHTIDNQNRPQLYDLQREKKTREKSIYSGKKCKNIAFDLSRHSLNCVMKVFTSFYWMWQKMCWITLAKYLWTFIVKRVLIKCYKIKFLHQKNEKSYFLLSQHCIVVSTITIQNVFIVKTYKNYS